MAISKIWSIKTGLSNAINYVTNDEKTNEDTYNELHNELKYISNNFKTEEKLYVTGINCDPNKAKREFIDTKRRYNKLEGITAFHAVQSFKELDITPEKAHEVGLEFANKIWGNRFQVVVATHLDKEHLHNHFIINSVSFIDGYKYHDTSASYADIRKLNDELCKKYGLNFMGEKITKAGYNYRNFQLKNENENIYDKQLKLDVDMAIGLASSYEEFKNILNNMNYEVYERSGKLGVKSLEYNRSVRLERRFKEDYSIENIKKRILGIYLPENKTYYRNYFKKDELIDKLFKLNCKGLAMRYIKYLKMLNNYPSYIRGNKISFEMQKEVYKMENISKQTILLATNNIQTKDDLISLYGVYKNKLNKDSSNKELIENIQLINEIIKRTELTDDSAKENKKEVVIHEPVK